MSQPLIHEAWPIEKFIEYDKNPRINDHAVAQVAAAIDYFGFRIPIVAKSDGTVVDGHLRLKAARKLGMMTLPVILADDMTDDQIKAFRISVNKMAELADWDRNLLRDELLDLHGIEFDVGLLGFDMKDIFEADIVLQYEKQQHSFTETQKNNAVIECICPNCERTFNINK